MRPRNKSALGVLGAEARSFISGVECRVESAEDLWQQRSSAGRGACGPSPPLHSNTSAQH